MKILSLLVLGCLFSVASYSQLTSFPVSVSFDGVTGGCTIPMEITYCWQELNSESKSYTASWPMTPSATAFEPITEGFQTDGEFSPGTVPPIYKIEIGGVVIDKSNHCACFNMGGCCFQVCLTTTKIEVIYYDCINPLPGCSTVHSI